MQNKLKWNGAKLKERREKKGYSQTTVAEFFDITPQSYGEWERNETKPDSNNLTKLCIYFDCAAQDFFDVPENIFIKI